MLLFFISPTRIVHTSFIRSPNPYGIIKMQKGGDPVEEDRGRCAGCHDADGQRAWSG